MKKIYSILLIAAMALSGCGFLDKEPDMRTEIDTKQKVRLLLVSAYTEGNSGAIMEFSSDNIIDLNAPDKAGHCMKLNPLDKMYDEIFAWKDVRSSGEEDSPKYLWDAHYTAIAAANQALKAIEKLEAQGEDMKAEKGEALLCRAYHHFLLACVFCQAYKDDEASNNDLGIVYMTEPETSVRPHYVRPSLTQTYKDIEADLQEGLKLVSDNYYTIPKFHFNVKAANAFAARFYLYKREYNKVVEHANIVCGTTREATLNQLCDYNHIQEFSQPEPQFIAWTDASMACNLLIHTTMSQAPYTIFPSYGRYQAKDEALTYSVQSAGPCWRKGAFQNVMSNWMVGNEYGIFLAKFWFLFEYTDKVNGYGYIHGVTRAFTVDETLLCRAEAKVFLNDKSGAIEDMEMWCTNANKCSGRMDTLKGVSPMQCDLTQQKIDNFYAGYVGTPLAPELHNLDMSASFRIPAGSENLIYAVLHMRRIETFEDGWRWMDLKRYGIEISHKQGLEPVNTLTWNDPRRAIQIPQEVILSGLQANPRVNAETGTSSVTTITNPSDNLNAMALTAKIRSTQWQKDLPEDEE